MVGREVDSETEVNFGFPPSSSLTCFWDPFSPVSSADLYDYDDTAASNDPFLLDDEVVFDEVDFLVG